MKLVDDWKSAWRWNSVQLIGLLTALPVLWAQVPDDIKAQVPDSVMAWVPLVMGIAATLGRLRAQPSV